MGSSEDTTNPETNTLSKREREVKSLSSSPQTSGGWLKSQSMLVSIFEATCNNCMYYCPHTMKKLKCNFSYFVKEKWDNSKIIVKITIFL